MVKDLIEKSIRMPRNYVVSNGDVDEYYPKIIRVEAKVIKE